MYLSARVTGFDALSWKAFEKPVTGALKTTLQNSVYGLQREIADSLKSNFFVPIDPNRVSLIYIGRKSGKIYSAQLSYRYEAIPLSRYPVKQYRITTGSRILRVTRGGKSKTNAFQQRIVPKANIATYIQIRKAGGMKLVHGKLGFMGWLHTGSRQGQTDYYGNVQKNFSAQIFERNQQATWEGGQRLPIHRLFGPSIMELVMYPETQTAIAKSKSWQKITGILGKNL